MHDAGIIYRERPRVVVAMTWDAFDEDAASFISSIGSLVYSANLDTRGECALPGLEDAIAADVGTELE